MFAGLNADYYGPPRPGQSYTQYNEFMNIPIAPIGVGIAAALLLNPVVGIGAGVATWLMSDSTTKRKSQTQGG